VLSQAPARSNTTDLSIGHNNLGAIFATGKCL
jgi:hypothetical protein